MSAEMRCATCKHWVGKVPDFGTCRKAQTLASGRAVGFPTSAAAVPVKMGYGRFQHEDIYGVLETASNFFCNQFEFKTEAIRMLHEISQIQRFIAAKHGLKVEGEGISVRVVGEVPDGDHIIPIGVKETPFHVQIRKGFITIGEKAQ